MFIRVEPRDWSMYTVFLYFNEGAPHVEDEAIKKYLDDNGLLPRRQFKAEMEGQEFDVLSFGGCYLGQRHMNAIAGIQRSVVERELLAQEIPHLLRHGPRAEVSDLLASMDDARMRAAIDALVNEYHQDSSFEADAENQLQVVLDAAQVQESFLRVAGQSVPSE